MGAEVLTGGPSRDRAVSMASVHGTQLHRSSGEVAERVVKRLQTALPQCLEGGCGKAGWHALQWLVLWVLKERCPENLLDHYWISMKTISQALSASRLLQRMGPPARLAGHSPVAGRVQVLEDPGAASPHSPQFLPTDTFSQ